MVYVRLLPLFLILKPIHAAHMCTDLDNLNTVVKGRLLHGSIIRNTTTAGLITCSRDCLLRRRCKSFNFNRETGECHLNSKTRESASQLKSHDSFVFSDISAWPETLTGRCTNHTCPLNSYCESLNKSHQVCKTTGCLGYPAVNHGHLRKTHVPEESPKGTVLSYTCDEEYMHKGELVCQDDGTWFSAVCVGIPSCSKWKQIHTNSEDGEYWLRLTNFDNIRTRMYCHLMSASSAASEFLTLPNMNHGIFPRMQDEDCNGVTTQLPSGCKDKGGEIWFNKVRVNITTMEVLTEDRTFANFSHRGDKLRYGVATDCYAEHRNNSRKCETRGKFTIDLRGTGWRIGNDQEWEAFGWMPMIERVDRQMNGTLVNLKCGGYSGGCQPKKGLFLKPASWVSDRIAGVQSKKQDFSND